MSRKLALTLAVTFLFLAGCGATDTLVKVGQAVRDDDDDGWFNNATNQRMTLKLDAISFPQGRYHFFADGARLPLAGSLEGAVDAPDLQSSTVDIPLTSRAIGRWMLDQQDQLVSFSTPVTFIREGSEGRQFEKTVTWTNREGTIDMIIGEDNPAKQWIARFRVTIEQFGDPSPNDPEADTDADGITEREEAALAERGGPVGDPGKRDLVLVVVHTHPDWGMTSLSRRLLMTRFKQRGINIYLAHDPGESFIDARPGRVEGVERGWAPSISDARDLRDRHIFGLARNYSHLVVLASRPAASDADYGKSELCRSSARNLTCRSHLWEPLIGPDFREYQAKCVMHELGHNLGLCHPTLVDSCGSGSGCPTGLLPTSEQNAGATVMGAPSEDRGNPLAQGVNAWSRPFDYSSTQWNNLNLRRVR